jgi:hypothetical protein
MGNQGHLSKQEDWKDFLLPDGVYNAPKNGLEEPSVGVLLLIKIGVEVEIVAEGLTGGVKVAEELNLMFLYTSVVNLKCSKLEYFHS